MPGDGVWHLAVDRDVRTWTSSPPLEPLPESAYAPVAAGPRYRFDVSENGRRIEVAEPRMVGRLQGTSSGRSTFDLVEGAPTGGRIVVWRGSRGLEAELTIYGSGVPIIKSERGALQKAG